MKMMMIVVAVYILHRQSVSVLHRVRPPPPPTAPQWTVIQGAYKVVKRTSLHPYQ